MYSAGGVKMKAIGSVLRVPLKAIGVIKSMPRVAQPQRTVTRDDARDRSAMEDELRRRRGGAADMMTGSGGAEAGSGGKTTLG